MAERGQLGAGSHRPQYPARPVRRGPAVSGRAGEPGGGLGQFRDPLGDPVFTKIAQVGAERVGGDAIRAGLQVSLVNAGDDIGPGNVQDLVAALVGLEVVNGGVTRLEHGAHCPVGHHDSLGQSSS